MCVAYSCIFSAKKAGEMEKCSLYRRPKKKREKGNYRQGVDKDEQTTKRNNMENMKRNQIVDKNGRCSVDIRSLCIYLPVWTSKKHTKNISFTDSLNTCLNIVPTFIITK